MAQDITPELKAHYAQTATTLAHLWKTTWATGAVFGFTEHDRNISFGGVTYKASTGYTRGSIQSRLDMSVDNFDVHGAFVSSGITEADLRAGFWDYAQIEIREVNWADLSMGARRLPGASFGEARFANFRYSIEIRGLGQKLLQEAGRLFGPIDDATLDDPRSGLAEGLYTFTGTITDVWDTRRFYDTARTEADTYFDRGRFRFTNGPNAGLWGRDVKSFINGSSEGYFEMQIPFPYPVEIGHAYEVTAGYDGSLVQARDKFFNVDDWRGFNTIPGFDQMITGGK